jgi:selenocysteine-specific elongation factor
MVSTVIFYHNENPLKKGMPREELKSKQKLDNKIFNLLFSWVTDNGMLMEKGPLVWAPGHEIRLSDEQQKKIDILLAEFERELFSPPTIKTCIEKVGEQLYQAMLELGLLIPISSDVAFMPETYEKAVVDIKELIGRNGSVSLGQARDHWGTTRRYVQALLEYMDQQGITKRDGDTRVLR